MGRVASSVDNTMIESFWSTMQRELLDTRRWATQEELTSAIFEWIEAWSQPAPPAHLARHAQSRRLRTPLEALDPSHGSRRSGMITTPPVSGEPGQAPSLSSPDQPVTNVCGQYT